MKCSTGEHGDDTVSVASASNTQAKQQEVLRLMIMMKFAGFDNGHDRYIQRESTPQCSNDRWPGMFKTNIHTPPELHADVA